MTALRRKWRVDQVFKAFYPDAKRGAVKWFCEQERVCVGKVSQSAVYRWFDGDRVVGGDLLEGLLQVLEADAMLMRLDRAEAEVKAIRKEIR